MPFKSEKQRRYLFANEPEIAKDWTETYGSKIQKKDGGIMRLAFKEVVNMKRKPMIEQVPRIVFKHLNPAERPTGRSSHQIGGREEINPKVG